MNSIQSVNSAATQAQGIIKDATGSQLIIKTLENMNTFQTLSGPKIDAGYQLRKDMLNAAGIGTVLNSVV